MVTTRMFLCPKCSATADRYDGGIKWRYANALNSTHFCRCCGTAMSEYNLTDREIEDYQKEHEDWVNEYGDYNRF